mgnify:CR=1 FL=1
MQGLNARITGKYGNATWAEALNFQVHSTYPLDISRQLQKCIHLSSQTLSYLGEEIDLVLVLGDPNFDFQCIVQTEVDYSGAVQYSVLTVT